MTEEGNSITCNDEDINYDGTIPSAYANSSMNLNYDSLSSFFFHSIKKENGYQELKRYIILGKQEVFYII